MPFIHIVVPAGKLTEEQKARMSDPVTAAAVEAEGDPAAREVRQPVSRRALAAAAGAAVPK